MTLDSEDLAAISDLLTALDAWRARHPKYSTDEANVWCDGEELLGIGMRDGRYVLLPMNLA